MLHQGASVVLHLEGSLQQQDQLILQACSSSKQQVAAHVLLTHACPPLLPATQHKQLLTSWLLHCGNNSITQAPVATLPRCRCTHLGTLPKSPMRRCISALNTLHLPLQMERTRMQKRAQRMLHGHTDTHTHTDREKWPLDMCQVGRKTLHMLHSTERTTVHLTTPAVHAWAAGSTVAREPGLRA